MFTHKNPACQRSMWIRTVLLASSMTLFSCAQQTGPAVSLGTPINESQLSQFDLIIYPNGQGLPPGTGTARAGKILYDQQCASCHGISGEGIPGTPAVAGGRLPVDDNDSDYLLTVGNFWPYSSTLFDYIRRAMPPGAPKSLSNNDTYAVVAYVLKLNNLVEAETVISRENLATIKMPNADGFIDQSHILD
jgi:S-disulfanyl-L-cysteine oxidoreductase SoxD